MARLDFDSTAGRAADGSSRYFLLSALTQEILLDIIGEYGQTWRWLSSVYSDDYIEATLAQASLELMTDTTPAGAGMQPIADILLTEDAAGIEITSIPPDYAHLLLVLALRTDRAATTDDVMVSMNSVVSGGKYDTAYELVSMSSGSVIHSQANSQNTAVIPGASSGNNAEAGRQSNMLARIPNYALSGAMRELAYELVFTGNSNVQFIQHGQVVFDDAEDELIELAFYPVVGDNFLAGSRVTIYGLEAL